MKRSLAMMIAGTLLAVAGCGEPKVSMGSPVDVSGSVKTADGKPVGNVRVLLLPMNTKAGANAVTDATGAFKLKTFDSQDGALPGKYRVQIAAVMNGNKAETEKSQAALKSLPAQYTADDSPLEAEVASGKSLDIVIPAK